jgi:hypothetical protein
MSFGIRSSVTSAPLPAEFLDWQVKLRRWTMEHRNGSPHAGVAPVLAVRQPGVGPGVALHSLIVGLLPRADRLAAKTAEFRALYESGEGRARVIYDRGIEYLRSYYASADDFDPHVVTSLLPRDTPAVRALRADARCALLFYVFDLDDRSEEGRFRCLQVNCHAEVHEDGPLFENVWWHNTLFHGKLDEQAMLCFRHVSTYDTRFGMLEPL